MTARLVLASTSPRRRELLARLGVEFDVLAVDVDEAPLDGEQPERYVGRLGEAKALAPETEPGTVAIAADTAIDLDGEILGKPRDEAHATAMLERLAGRWHRVHTGVAVTADGGTVVQVVTTDVEMVPSDDDRIAWYVATGEPLVAAGAYQIQGRGDVLVSAVNGSISNVIGLPLATVVDLIARHGITLRPANGVAPGAGAGDRG